MHIGIDLDNTIIDYDGAFATIACERGLVPPDFSGTKRQLRDHVRSLTGGEKEWQQLQGYVYGQGIGRAKLFGGVREFMAVAAAHRCPLHIVSHKTEYGHYDESRTSLRESARSFLQAHSIAHPVAFADTRGEKVKMIAALGVECFIDDLAEVFEEPHFPKAVRKILLHTADMPAPAGDWQLCRSWDDITKTVFV